jgi:hypothetical protein
MRGDSKMRYVNVNALYGKFAQSSDGAVVIRRTTDRKIKFVPTRAMLATVRANFVYRDFVSQGIRGKNASLHATAKREAERARQVERALGWVPISLR